MMPPRTHCPALTPRRAVHETWDVHLVYTGQRTWAARQHHTVSGPAQLDNTTWSADMLGHSPGPNNTTWSAVLLGLTLRGQTTPHGQRTFSARHSGAKQRHTVGGPARPDTPGPNNITHSADLLGQTLRCQTTPHGQRTCSARHSGAK